MKTTLKMFLDENHNQRTKKELVAALKQLYSSIGAKEFSTITGVQKSEFETLPKQDIISILKQFKSGYKQEWETAASAINALFSGANDGNTPFRAADAANADFAAELGDIDFAKLIGGPLNACVTAQTNASVSTVNFIKEVGFDEDDHIRMVDFTHKKNSIDANGNTVEEDVELKIPFLALLNVPSLRIETCDIDFNVKLNSTYTKDTSSSFGVDASVSGKFWSVKFKVSASYKRSSSTGIKVEKQYTMGVKVRATNDEMPAGLEKVLGILAS